MLYKFEDSILGRERTQICLGDKKRIPFFSFASFLEESFILSFLSLSRSFRPQMRHAKIDICLARNRWLLCAIVISTLGDWMRILERTQTGCYSVCIRWQRPFLPPYRKFGDHFFKLSSFFGTICITFFLLFCDRTLIAFYAFVPVQIPRHSSGLQCLVCLPGIIFYRLSKLFSVSSLSPFRHPFLGQKLYLHFISHREGFCLLFAFESLRRVRGLYNSWIA